MKAFSIPSRTTRRTILKAAAATLVAPLSSAAADSEIELSPATPGAEISPHIYGHFIEHLGGVIHDGIWVGKSSKIANVNGIRKQFADDMKQLAAPNIRWPGGCFADDYDWRNGIGPQDHRPRTASYWGAQMPPELHGAEPNIFGTHEFMQLCRLTGAEPYLAANLASGTPREFHDWLTYCNAPAGTATLADQRAANGDIEPFNVRFWGIGNESWNCGGMLKAAEYSTLYRLFASQIPPFGKPFLVACGPRGHSADNGVPWTEGFFESLKGVSVRVPVNGLSMHFYTDFRPTKVTAEKSTADEWYAVLEKGLVIEKAIISNWAAMQKYDPSGRIKFVIDEWGIWYSGSPEIAPGYNLAQVVTLRDAVHTAMHFDIFNRHADKIAMANVAQTINCLHSLFLAHGDRYARTPVFHVFEMYKDHMGAKLLPATMPVHQDSKQAISSSASIRDKQLTVTLTNPSVTAPQTIRIKINGRQRPLEAEGRILTHQLMNATNSLDKPNEVHPIRQDVAISGDSITVTLPSKSVAALRIRLSN